MSTMRDIFEDPRSWLWAAVIGAGFGLFDGIAWFLHPVIWRAIPFAVALYTLLGVAAHLCGRLALFWFPRRAARSVLLAMEFAAFVVFFAAYAASTATGGWLGTRAGLLVAVVGGGSFGLVGGIAIARAVLGRGDRRILSAVVTVSVATYPLIAGVAALSHGDATGRGVILVSMDAARGDRVHALGYPRPTTPHLDELVRGGLAFRDAYVRCPGSGPSHATMLTGLSPLSHKVLSNADVLADEVETIAERFRERGFDTAAFANNFYIDGRYGFDQGFDTFVNQYRAWAVGTWDAVHLLRATAVYHALHRLTRVPGAKNEDSLRGALRWLRGRGDGDFFLFLHLMDPHAPYDAPPAIRDRFYRPTGTPVRDTAALRARLDRASPEEIAALRDLYDASIALADAKLGRLVETLREKNLLQNTLIVVTADHGEILDEQGPVFDHGLPGHGNLHVPLVIHGPSLLEPSPPRSGAIANERWIEIVESLLDRRPVKPTFDEPFYGLTGVAPSDVAFAFDGRYKLLLREGRVVGFFDLLEDPAERVDLSPKLEDDESLLAVARRLEVGLLDWLESEVENAVVRERRTDDAVDAQTRRSLKALGYIE